jgi:23S rRNA (adenine2030-N6)-methyltransferase
MLQTYSHHYHAGNIGDVWKHVVLHAFLNNLVQRHTHVHMLECHGGAGSYALQSTGEWTAGAGALLASLKPHAPKLVHAYTHALRTLGFDPPHQKQYPGSPLQAAQLLRPTDTLTAYEWDSDTARTLATHLPYHQAVHGNGLEALLAHAHTARTALPHTCYFAHIDPPWTQKSDWQHIPEQLHQAYLQAPTMALAMWYPIKSYTRVSAMLKNLTSKSVPAVALDLITTPLHYQRARLNGSGMLLVNAPTEVVSEALSAGAYIGETCATRGTYFHVQATRLI